MPTRSPCLGIAYFLNVGKEPVYQKTIVVPKGDARITAHRITDALLGALTGRPGSFASELTFSGKWAQNRRIFRMDADGNSLLALTDPMDTAIAPNFGAPGHILYSVSHEYAPFTVMDHFQNVRTSRSALPFNDFRVQPRFQQGSQQARGCGERRLEAARSTSATPTAAG